MMAVYLSILLHTVGVILNMIGAALMFFHANQTMAATTQADQDFLASRRWFKGGLIALFAGFGFQLIALLLPFIRPLI